MVNSAVHRARPQGRGIQEIRTLSQFCLILHPHRVATPFPTLARMAGQLSNNSWKIFVYGKIWDYPLQNNDPKTTKIGHGIL